MSIGDVQAVTDTGGNNKGFFEGDGDFIALQTNMLNFIVVNLE